MNQVREHGKLRADQILTGDPAAGKLACHASNRAAAIDIWMRTARSSQHRLLAPIPGTPGPLSCQRSIGLAAFCLAVRFYAERRIFADVAISACAGREQAIRGHFAQNPQLLPVVCANDAARPLGSIESSTHSSEAQ
jgi:hypothetical protein